MLTRPFNTLVIGLCAAVGASGFWLGRVSAPHGPQASGSTPVLHLNGAKRAPWKPGEARYILISNEGEDLKAACERVMQAPDRGKRQRLLNVFLESVNPEEYPFLISFFEPQSDGPKGLGMGPLWRRWAEVDPKAAWSRLQEGSEGAKKQFSQTLIQGWMEHNENEALAFIDQLPEGPEKKTALQTSLRKLGETSAARAIARLSSIASLDTPDNWSHIIGSISQSDPRKAIEFTLQIPPGEKRNRAIQSIANRWSDADLSQAYSWVSQLPPDETRSRAQASIIGRLARKDPEKAAEFFLQEHQKDPTLRNSAHSVAHHLAEKNIDSAIAWLAKLPEGQSKQSASSALLSHWAKTDPEKALGFAMNQPQASSHYNSPVTTVLSQWMRSGNSEKGMQWIEKNFDSLRPREIQTLASNLSHDNPLRALDLLSLLPEGANQYHSIQHPANRLTTKDRGAAEDYLQQLPEGKVRDYFLQGYISALAQQAPTEAREKVGKLPDGDLKNTLLNQVAHVMAGEDPLSAIAWVSREANEKNRANNIATIINQWGNNDSAAAAKWINAQPKGPERDQITQSFVYTLSQNAPENAVQWAESIQDENRRKSALQSVAQTWSRNDPVRAKEWIEKTNSLPEDLKKHLLRQNN